MLHGGVSDKEKHMLYQVELPQIAFVSKSAFLDGIPSAHWRRLVHGL